MKKILLLSLFTSSAWPMEPAAFPVIPLTVKYASMSPDTSTVVGITKDPDNSSKVRLVTISKERENPEYPVFSDVPLANQGNNITLFAWNPVRQLIAFANRDRNITFLQALKNNLYSVQSNSTREQMKEAIHTLAWNPKGDTLLAASADTVLAIPVLSFDLLELCQNCQTTQIQSGTKDSKCNAALWSPSGNKILIKATLDQIKDIITVIDWQTQSVEAEFASQTQLCSIDWHDEDAKSLLFATRHAINRVKYDRAVSSQKNEYRDPSNDIEQILVLNDRMMVFKTRQDATCSLSMLDRKTGKVLPLHNAVCQGTLKLSSDKRFVYGSEEGDSIVDLFSLTNSSRP